MKRKFRTLFGGVVAVFAAQNVVATAIGGVGRDSESTETLSYL